MFFFGDDIGYGDLGAYGNPTSETPGLDQMAADGAKLLQYYSAASICTPSRGSLMTGRNFVSSHKACCGDVRWHVLLLPADALCRAF